MVIGYLKFIEGFGIRKIKHVGNRARAIYDEYSKGQVIPIYTTEDPDIELIAAEGVAEVLDKQ